MSLLKCPKCGEMFSDSYKTCPFCEEDEAFANGGKKPVNPGRRVHRQKSPSILGPTLVGAVSAFAASKMMAAQGLTAVIATAEQVDTINKAASPYGILSVILIIIAGAVLYFAVLPRTLKGDQRKI